MRNLILIVFIIYFSFSYSYFEEEEDSGDDATTSTSSGTTTSTSSGTDITDEILTSTIASCSDYVGTYYADITGNKGSSLQSSLVITYDSSAGTCTFATNQLPNHDVTETGFTAEVTATSNSFIVSASPNAASSSTSLTVEQSEGFFLNGVNGPPFR